MSLAFSPDGKTLASGDKGLVSVTVIQWDMTTRKQLDDFSRRAGSQEAVAFSLAFSLEGKLLAAASGDHGEVTLWDVTSWGELAASRSASDEPLGHPGASVAFSPDGQTLASGGRDGTVILLDVGPDVRELIEAACRIVNRDSSSQERSWFRVDTRDRQTCPDR